MVYGSNPIHLSCFDFDLLTEHRFEQNVDFLNNFIHTYIVFTVFSA